MKLLIHRLSIEFASNLYRVCIGFATEDHWRNIGGWSFLHQPLRKLRNRWKWWKLYKNKKTFVDLKNMALKEEKQRKNLFFLHL